MAQDPSQEELARGNPTMKLLPVNFENMKTYRKRAKNMSKKCNRAVAHVPENISAAAVNRAVSIPHLVSLP